MNSMMEPVLTKTVTGRLLILDTRGAIIHYRGEGRGDRLGPLAKQILAMLFHEPMIGAEIARRLHVWHQDVHQSLARLRRKGLVESWTALGENLAGNRILRRFYALNPEKVAIAIPVQGPTEIQLQRIKEKAQSEALQREREGIRRMRLLSPKPSTRMKALINQSQNR